MPATAVGAPERRKISVNLQPAAEEQLTRIAEARGLRQSEVINEALKLLAFITDETARNRRVFTVNKDGDDPRELVLL